MKSICKETTNQIHPGEGTRDDGGDDFNPVSYSLRAFALIVCAQRCCAGNATVICHASLRLTSPEDKHGVENARETNFRPAKLLWIIGDPYFFNNESLTLLTIYEI